MVDAVTGTSTVATLQIANASAQIAATTNTIASQIDAAQSNAGQINTGSPPSAVFGSSAVSAPPVTGTQPSNAAAQVFQALQTPPAVGTSATAQSVSRSPAYDVSYQPSSPAADGQGLVARPNENPVQQTVEVATATNAFAANVQSLQTTNQINHRILDVTT
ncbi:hypothetical protein GCM10011611_48920 [Aliidongia dinghuensis]|uniref:Uncharacterized protein n=1 Tax=Aliidongia dinghuensis TaxID=1867774 RepID=A0A8J3E5N6_9PROT|nr:hypothetical protein [Aliidongia dinghuensis]GGF36653.1 hypothetical protein GCM10011611_48920 [Aliidongia dinghuensis]